MPIFVREVIIMNKNNSPKKKTSIQIGFMTVVDFLLFIFFSMTLIPQLGVNLHQAYLALIALAATLLINLLMIIPIFGQIVKIICGLGMTAGLYYVIEFATANPALENKGIMTMLFDSARPAWITLITIAVIISVLLHLGGCIQRCPVQKPAIPANDIFEEVHGLPPGCVPYEPDSVAPIHKAAEMFNAAQQHYLDIMDEISTVEVKTYPQEFISILQNLEKQYETLENRMKAYIELANQISGTTENEMVTDITAKANAVDKAVVQLESAFRLLKQSMQNERETQASFFRGCNTSEELKMRYNKLAQAYHPDLEVGDEETMKEINNEYEQLKSQMSKSKMS